ncbi:MAG: helix-turn-helix transcriptional regulator [Chitinophagaceae bacterium]|nr:helix-turn-helix transcriptional regulator [Chitinophagaceae bacterium]
MNDKRLFSSFTSYIEPQHKPAILQKIKELRRKHSYSQQEVAELLNMGQNTYSDMESGKTKLDIERLYQIAGLYKVHLNVFLGAPPR